MLLNFRRALFSLLHVFVASCKIKFWVSFEFRSFTERTLFFKVAEELIRWYISSSAHLENEAHSNLIPECFPSAQAYHTNSVVSTVILHSLPLLRILRNNKSVLQLEVAILLFLERSSVYDWKLRLDYLQSVMDSFFSEGSVQCDDVTTIIKSFLQSFGSVFVSELMKNLKNEMKNLKSTRFSKYS